MRCICFNLISVSFFLNRFIIIYLLIFAYNNNNIEKNKKKIIYNLISITFEYYFLFYIFFCLPILLYLGSNSVLICKQNNFLHLN